jgi:hypothetical protein
MNPDSAMVIFVPSSSLCRQGCGDVDWLQDTGLLPAQERRME